jgi:predicted RNA-binding protein YlxR (DUF448 family)
VLDGDGIAHVDRNGPGRGAWLCGSECLDVAIRRKAFDRAWRTTVRAGQLEGLAGELDRRRSG